MIIYKDILTGDEMFTDSNKLNLVDDCLYEVLCTHVTRKQGEIVLDGANPSAEEGDELGGTDEAVESGLDLVLNQRLQVTSFNKADYKNYLKTYTKAWVLSQLLLFILFFRKRNFDCITNFSSLTYYTQLTR